MELDSVSVLVATRDRPLELLKSMESILACRHPQFEVIVIDQSATPASLPQDNRLMHVHADTVGKSRALNQAIRAARGRLLAFTDDDCTVPSDWLSRGTQLLADNPGVALVFGALTAMPHDPSQGFVPVFDPSRFEVLTGVRSGRFRGGAGANMFARRELFTAIGGFDDLFGPGARFRSSEEYDVYYRTLKAGFAVARDPNNQVVHWGIRPYSDGSGQRLKRGYYFGEGAVLGKHVRNRDVSAARLGGRIALDNLAFTGRNLIRGRRTGLGVTASWARGFLAAISAGVAPESALAEARARR